MRSPRGPGRRRPRCRRRPTVGGEEAEHAAAREQPLADDAVQQRPGVVEQLLAAGSRRSDRPGSRGSGPPAPRSGRTASSRSAPPARRADSRPAPERRVKHGAGRRGRTPVEHQPVGPRPLHADLVAPRGPRPARCCADLAGTPSRTCLRRTRRGVRSLSRLPATPTARDASSTCTVGPVVVRLDLHGSVHPRRRRAADQERQVEPLPLHLARDEAHLLERRRDQPAQADQVHVLAAGPSPGSCADGTITPRSITS